MSNQLDPGIIKVDSMNLSQIIIFMVWEYIMKYFVFYKYRLFVFGLFVGFIAIISGVCLTEEIDLVIG